MSSPHLLPKHIRDRRKRCDDLYARAMQAAQRNPEQAEAYIERCHRHLAILIDEIEADLQGTSEGGK